MKTEEELTWESRSQRVWLAMAVIYTLWPFAPMVSSELATWLEAPRTLGGRMDFGAVATFFWFSTSCDRRGEICH
jgi:hypothetical protein